MAWAANFSTSTVYLAQGRFPEAYTTLQQTLALTGVPATADERGCENTSITANIVEQPWITESLKPLVRAVILNNIGLTIAVPLSQQQSIGATYENAKNCFEAALQILDQLSGQSVNPEAALSELLILAALGSSEEAINHLLTNMLVNTAVPELAKAFEPILLSNLGQIYAFNGDYKQAQAHLEQALQQIKTNQAQNNASELQTLLPLIEPVTNLLRLDTSTALHPDLINSVSLQIAEAGHS